MSKVSWGWSTNFPLGTKNDAEEGFLGKAGLHASVWAAYFTAFRRL
jgi:hypothetical protein